MPNDFDESANNYDEVFTYSEIGKAQRNRVYHYLNTGILDPYHKKSHLNVLEINCGTGEDAHFFWEKGHKVLATDISEKMIDKAISKYPNTSIEFKKQDIRSMDHGVFNQKFDLIFSNFGGLNCLDRHEVKEFILKSSELLNPFGKMVLVVMPKKCLWERGYFMLKGQFRKAFRRNTNDKVLSDVNGVKVPTWYYQPKEMASFASMDYHTALVKPIGISIPPSYLEPFFKNKKILLKTLVRIEKLLVHKFFAGYADHYIISFQKK